MRGDFDSSMKHEAVRRVVESAARAMQARDNTRSARSKAEHHIASRFGE